MKVQFYFDPVCPFCWITSRWLLMVSNDRDIDIQWRPFSLAIKNQVLGKTELSDHDRGYIDSHRFLRVALKAARENDTDLLTLYTASGMQKHILGDRLDDEAVARILEDNNLPAELMESLNDEAEDKQIQAAMDEVLEIVGDDVGVPIIVFENEDGTKSGYFGPVLDSLPSKAEALKIWDGLSQLATIKSFYELKRSRDHDPDVASTAKC